jgi:O-antigen/teichoic acid export membrane protein
VLSRIRKILPKGEFSHNISILAGSAAFAQGIGVLAAPILTRLYSPSDYGIVAVFGSVVALLLVVATFRFEWAIPNPEKDEDAINLLVICFIVLLFIALFSFPVMLVLFNTLDMRSDIATIKPYLWLVPLYIVGGASYQTLNAWAIRKKNFTPIAKTRFSQSISGSAITIGLGLFKWGPLGLLVGGFVGQSAGIGTLASLLWREDRQIFHSLRKENIIFYLKRYMKFAALSSGVGIVNTASLQMTTFLLISYFEASVVGWYALAQRVIAVPTGLIGQATAQTFWAEAAQLIRTNPQGLKQLFLKFSKRLALLSLIIAVLGIISPFAFGIVFGTEKWTMAGYYALYLTPMIMAQFVVGTLSHLAVHELQHWQFAWDICRLVLICLCFWITHNLGFTADVFILIYSVMMSGMYLVLYMMNLNALQIRIKAVL